MSAPILSSAEAREVAVAGGKAAALAALIAEGFDTPPFLVLTAQAFDGDGLREDVATGLRARLVELAPGPYAVRSSAREEDGAQHSHAGPFLSLLDVAAEDVAAAAARVDVGRGRLGRGLSRRARPLS